MSLVLIVLLVSAVALAGADRYGDYAGVSMPQYSMEEGSRDAVPPVEDYLERSPDAPIPFDYKYEEDLRDKGNKLLIKTEDENWHNQSKKIKQPPNIPDDDERQKHEVVKAPKSVVSRKNRRHRTRIKNKDLDREEISYRQKAASKVRSRKIDKDAVDVRNYYYANKGRKREDNSIESDDINFRETTEKIIRRKPRDKRINLRRMDVDDEDDDEDLKTLERDDIKHFARDEDVEYPDNPRTNSRRFMIARPPEPVPEKTKMRNKNYPEYDDDYYDMKRVKDMKNKLPDLLHRRTQATTTPSASVAERELKALLGHRQRKEAPSSQPPSKTHLPATFPPDAVNIAINDEWLHFIGANNARKPPSILYLNVLTLIYCLQYYR